MCVIGKILNNRPWFELKEPCCIPYQESEWNLGQDLKTLKSSMIWRQEEWNFIG